MHLAAVRGGERRVHDRQHDVVQRTDGSGADADRYRVSRSGGTAGSGRDGPDTVLPFWRLSGSAGHLPATGRRVDTADERGCRYHAVVRSVSAQRSEADEYSLEHSRVADAAA